jgi:hypothetical protein
MRMTICLLLVAVTLNGADKQRAWLRGLVLESGSERRSEITGSRTTVDSDGNSTTRARRSQSDEYTYSIEGADRVYTITESVARLGGAVSFAVGKRANINPGDSILYAIEKNQLYVLVEGRERKFKIARIALKR